MSLEKNMAFSMKPSYRGAQSLEANHFTIKIQNLCLSALSMPTDPHSLIQRTTVHIKHAS